ncbi:hypothetical protein C0995_011370 [Termitomyces sp. Mi166|nr:hypothetical protein C0995_011370 [Termitomyces sp. Mi166\
MSGPHQTRPSSPAGQIDYPQHQRESSLSPGTTRNFCQGSIAMDAMAGLQHSTLFTQPFPQQQHGQTAMPNVDTLKNSTNPTRSSTSFYAGLNLGGQISVASLPIQHSRDLPIAGHAAHKSQVLSGTFGKVSRNIAKLALRVAGSAVEIATGVPVSTEAVVGFVDVVTNLINRFASCDMNTPSISRADLEAVFQGAPSGKYEEVIRALMMAQAQQQKAAGTAPAFKIQVLIDELRRLQALADAPVRVVQDKAYPSLGQMGLMEQFGSMEAVTTLKSNAQSQAQPNVLSTYAPGALSIPEYAVYASESGIEPNARIHQAPAPPQFHPLPGLTGRSTALPTHQMHVASDAKLCRDFRDRLDDRDVSNDEDAGPARLSAEFMQQQEQLRTTLLQQQQQMTLLQQQQQQLMHFLLEQQKQKQDFREERTLSADFSSSISVGSRPDSRNEVTSLPLPLT